MSDFDTSELLEAARRRNARGMSAEEFDARTHASLADAGIRLEHPHRDARLFRGQPLTEHGRALARARGERPGNTAAGVVDRELAAHQEQRDLGALGGATLPDLITNQARIAMLAGWSQAPVTWPAWCRAGMLESYRQESRVASSSLPALERVGENATIPYAARSSRAERITGHLYAKILAISRQLLLGDGAASWLREPYEAGRAARAAVEREAVNLLTSASGVGPTLNQDGVALFNSAHGNYVSSSGGPPDVATLTAACKGLRTRTDPLSGEVLGIVPRTLLVPASLEQTARVLVASQWNSPLGDGEGDLRVAVCPHLDSKTNGTTAWYVMADPDRFDVFEAAFVAGQDEPLLETQRGWDSDVAALRVSLSFGAAALDFRGAYRNIGA